MGAVRNEHRYCRALRHHGHVVPWELRVCSLEKGAQGTSLLSQKDIVVRWASASSAKCQDQRKWPQTAPMEVQIRY